MHIPTPHINSGEIASTSMSSARNQQFTQLIAHVEASAASLTFKEGRRRRRDEN